MIQNIVNDCVSFLFLAFIVLFGFALALHVLFRGLMDGALAHGGESNADDSNNKDVEDAFGTFQSSLATLFYALLGAFEPEVNKPVLHNHVL